MMDSSKKKGFGSSIWVFLALCAGFVGGLYLDHLTRFYPVLSERWLSDQYSSPSPPQPCFSLNSPSPELVDARFSASNVANKTVECPQVASCEPCRNETSSQDDLAEDELMVKRLPQTYIHKTTNYHRQNMSKLPYQDRPGPIPKSLLAMAVGFKQREHVDAFLQKFDEEHFQVVLFHYDNTVDKWRDYEWFQRVLHVQSEGQAKWWFAKRFLHPDVVAPYEYIFVWDEDLNLTNCDPLKFIDVMKRYELQIAQPAIEGATHWPITKRVSENETEIHYRTDEGGLKDKPCANETTTGGPCEAFVEIQAPVFEHKAWRCVWNLLQNDLVLAWGIDFLLRECVSAPAEKHMGIIDSQWILHDSAQSLYSQENQTTTEADTQKNQVLKRSFWEYGENRKRWASANNTRYKV